MTDYHDIQSNRFIWRESEKSEPTLCSEVEVSPGYEIQLSWHITQMLGKCWATACDGGPTFNQQWAKISSFLGRYFVSSREQTDSFDSRDMWWQTISTQGRVPVKQCGVGLSETQDGMKPHLEYASQINKRTWRENICFHTLKGPVSYLEDYERQ